MSDKNPAPLKELQCPTWLTGFAKEMWEYLAPKLLAKQILTEWDVQSFQMLCMAYAASRESYEIIMIEGQTTTSAAGVIQKHPATGIFAQNMSIYEKYAANFGLSPMSRKKMDISLKAVDKANKFARI